MVWAIIGLLGTAGCKPGGANGRMSDAERQAAQLVERDADAIDALNKQYPAMPDAKILENGGENSALYAELKAKYKSQLTQLKQEVEATGAKFVVILVTMEVGSGTTNSTRFGHPFIMQVCRELGIEYYDFSNDIARQDKAVITLAPKDGHWSRKGAVYFAGLLKPIFEKYKNHKCTTTYKDAERPETFGDLPPNDDEILDGGKDITYHVQANAQGLRMNHPVTFPKTKFRTLVLGGSYMYSPFLDNNYITTVILEDMLPNTEILNAGMINGTVDDYLSLWREKARFSEPDLVIMHTNGSDITDLYFSNRNHLARSHKPYPPTETERKFYDATFNHQSYK
jgi:hypothetical protein